jgi:predicted lipid-binding transport protein (Tim44 family)
VIAMNLGGSALLHTIAFTGVIAMILLTVWIALMLESSGDPPGTKQGAAKPGDHPDRATAPEREDPASRPAAVQPALASSMSPAMTASTGNSSPPDQETRQ